MLKLKSSVRLVDDENGTFLLDTRRGVYWHLNPSGMSLLQGLADGLTVEAIVQQVITEFAVDARTVREDFANVVRELKRARLVEEQG